MTEFIIDGKAYKMVCNIGSLTVAEVLNDGVDVKSQPIRYSVGVALSMFYGADVNCDLNVEDIMRHFGDTRAHFAELMDAVKKERELFEGINEAGNEPADEPEDESKKD